MDICKYNAFKLYHLTFSEVWLEEGLLSICFGRATTKQPQKQSVHSERPITSVIDVLLTNSKYEFLYVFHPHILSSTTIRIIVQLGF